MRRQLADISDTAKKSGVGSYKRSGREGSNRRKSGLSSGTHIYPDSGERGSGEAEAARSGGRMCCAHVQQEGGRWCCGTKLRPANDYRRRWRESARTFKCCGLEQVNVVG